LTPKSAEFSDRQSILIVDDNEDNRYTLQTLLEADGYQHITSASGGAEAISLIDNERFSLVLLDMMMPDLNGDEVLRLIRSKAETRDIPVVMISADTDTEKISKCIELGADDYLPKPFNPNILRARIGSALRRNSLRALEADYLSRVEKQKLHSETLLRSILPAEIAFRLRNGESNIADHYDDATVLFADIVGFGKITARMKAYEVIECLNHLFSSFDRLAEAAGVQQIKTSGDNYMAVAGIPRPSANHAQTAVQLAISMIEAAERLHLRLPEPFSIRVGLHSGPVMAGVIGTRKFTYDVWGDTVNIAARMEAASQPNRVLVSASTAGALGKGFVLDGPKKIPTKEERIVEAYFIDRPA
jgi:class 3 adenylate cyclase/CheY-like chemotaxis protein